MLKKLSETFPRVVFSTMLALKIVSTCLFTAVNGTFSTILALPWRSILIVHRSLSLIILMLTCSAVSYAAKPVFEIEIRDHLFLPDVIRIPADTKVKLLITNSDDAAEDFECYDLNREKMIGGHSTAVIFIGPVRAGEYHFFGEFFPKTAQGKIIVE